MNIIDELVLAEKIKFWANTITLGLMRFAIIAVCVKYLLS